MLSSLYTWINYISVYLSLSDSFDRRIFIDRKSFSYVNFGFIHEVSGVKRIFGLKGLCFILDFANLFILK